MNELVASFAADISGAPDWIMFAPAGVQRIQAKVDGRPQRVKITVDADAAAALNADLEARKADGGPQPFFDLHHDGREAAAYPVAFEWREGSGVWARVIWTPAGLEATKCDVANGILPSVRYFSPRCAIAGGRIVGLLPAERGNAAGGLVSDPAFERIAPLVASKQTNQDNTMTDAHKKRLMAMLDTEDDMEPDDLIEKLEAMCSGYKKKEMKAAKADELEPQVAELTAAKDALAIELSAVKSELEAMKAEREKAVEEKADAFVAELCASGKIPAKNESIRSFWRGAFIQDEASTLEASKHLGSKVQSERLTDDKPAETFESNGAKIEARAHELMASKAKLPWAQAWELAKAQLSAGE